MSWWGGYFPTHWQTSTCQHGKNRTSFQGPIPWPPIADGTGGTWTTSSWYGRVPPRQPRISCQASTKTPSDKVCEYLWKYMPTNEALCYSNALLYGVIIALYGTKTNNLIWCGKNLFVILQCGTKHCIVEAKFSCQGNVRAMSIDKTGSRILQLGAITQALNWSWKVNTW